MNNIYQLETYHQYRELPLCVVDMSKESQTADRPHSHNCSELTVVTSGEGDYLFEKSNVHISAGDVLLIHPGYHHSYQNTKSLGVINILYKSQKLPFPLLDGEELPHFRTLFPLEKQSIRCSANPIAHLEPAELAPLTRKIHELSEELLGAQPGTILCSMAKFTEILVLLLRQLHTTGRKSNAEQFKIVKAVSYINKHFTSNIRMRTLAEMAFMSQRQFFRIFHQSTGYTPLDYLNRLRLRHALNLLKTTRSHIDEIAYASGFNSSTYFCRKFRAHFNCTPQQARHQSEQEEPTP
ncbi:MAG: helix-turn-helix domain-containing protein [Victivallales bacterium]|nr:helix-turn-helix domain-containing protein [Victivallales bacterium]